MEIQELFAKHRAHFVDQLVAAFKEKGVKEREMLVAMDDDELEGIFMFYRADMVDGDGNAIDVEPEEFLSHERLEIPVDGKRLIIDPFVWSACDISLNKEPNDWDPILQWAGSWLDLDEEKKPNKNGIMNVLHQITTPEKDKEGWIHFTLDLGTVPAAALKELVHLLIDDEAIGEILISSSGYTGIS